MKIGDKYKIHCYKHNGEVYQSSEETIVLDIKDDYIVCGNYMVDVTEPEGHTYKTKELAIIYFYKKNWFNCIAQLKSFGLFYYCNIASPYIIDDNVIKYIDYDLDLKVFPDGNYRILDQEEYRQHAREMGYSEELDKILKKQLDVLIELAVKKGGPFDQDFTKKWYSFYQDLKEGYYGKSYYNR